MDTIMSVPTVSIIMPVYNCEAFVAEAIESVLKQSFIDFELIVIDDCSVDNTLKVIAGYADQRIRLIKKERNTGYVDSLNTAIQISRGKYLARMDGDDISGNLRLEKQVDFLENNPDIVLCGTWYQLLPTDQIVQNPVTNDEIKIALLDYCALGHPTVMVRKDFIESNNLAYNSEYRPAEDYELWTRISAMGKMANIPEALLHYRFHQGQVSNHERTSQLKHSLFCKVRMLCSPLAEVTDHDLIMAELIAKNQRVHNGTLLVEVIDWLDRLNSANTLSLFFALPQFNAYVDQKKAAFVRSFYLNTTPYNPRVLLDFLKAGSRFSVYFRKMERFKLSVKCLLFWRPGLI